MGLSRKRQRELSRLKGQAGSVWEDQKEVIDNANQILREASRQLSNYTREEVSPRVRETIDSRLKPAVATGISATVSAASTTKDRVVSDVLPAISSALGSALAVLDVARDLSVKDALKNAAAKGTAAKSKVVVVAAPKSSGIGKYFAIGIAVVAVAGVAYAAWQTLRADDDLWVDDDPAGSEAAQS